MKHGAKEDKNAVLQQGVVEVLQTGSCKMMSAAGEDFLFTPESDLGRCDWYMILVDDIH